ncbi:Aluminum-activated malate transporter 1 [Camellia lanceoleosa]|nr:Aluminum-activated malate transporter 1 [Camellia lanceoleosa]
MTMPSTANSHIANSKITAKTLKSLLETGSWRGTNLLDVIPAATVASLLIDVVTCTKKIAESVDELASLAKFKSVDDVVSKEPPPLTSEETLRPCSSIEEPPHHVVTIQSPGE